MSDVRVLVSVFSIFSALSLFSVSDVASSSIVSSVFAVFFCTCHNGIESQATEDGKASGDGDHWCFSDGKDDHPQRQQNEENGCDGVTPATIRPFCIGETFSLHKDASDGKGGIEREREPHIGDERVEFCRQQH